jgi:hypothetical protein
MSIHIKPHQKEQSRRQAQLRRERQRQTAQTVAIEAAKTDAAETEVHVEATVMFQTNRATAKRLSDYNFMELAPLLDAMLNSDEIYITELNVLRGDNDELEEDAPRDS